MSAAGQVTTGFSKPYVALYSETDGTITYSSGMLLARGVDVTISPEVSDSNNFYADNIEAESVNGSFTGGTLSLTVDGLLADAEALVLGLSAADDDGFVAYPASGTSPFVGFGYIARHMSDGDTTYQPIVLPKVAFNTPEDTAATQEEEIDWQTTAMEANIFRDDSSDQNWKYKGDEYATEALAEAALKTKLNIT